MLSVGICHHVGALATPRRVELLTKGKTRREWYTIEVLVPRFVVIELVSELSESSLEVVGHDAVELLFHLVALLVVVKTSFQNVGVFEVVQGCGYP